MGGRPRARAAGGRGVGPISGRIITVFPSSAVYHGFSAIWRHFAAHCDALSAVGHAEAPTIATATDVPAGIPTSGCVTDAGGGIGDVWLSVDDEYDLADVASIEVYPDADGEFSVSINLAAARNEDDMDGRCYTIYLHAENADGSDEASTSVAVVVPHDGR